MTCRYCIKTTFVAFFFILFSVSIQAQMNHLEASLDTKSYYGEDEHILFNSTSDKNVYYIDLELLDGNLSDLQILNINEEVIMEASLQEIPSDAFYELDLKDWQKGSYLLRIRTYKQEIKKDIIIE